MNKKNLCIKKKTMVLLCFFTIVVIAMSSKILISNAFEYQRIEDLIRKYYRWNEYNSGNLSLGSNPKDILAGGLSVELGSDPLLNRPKDDKEEKHNYYIVVNNDKIEYRHTVCYKGRFGYYKEKEKEKKLITKEETGKIKNLNITKNNCFNNKSETNKDEKVVDEYLYYTVDGKAVSYSLKTKIRKNLSNFRFNDKVINNIDVMYLVNNTYLYCLSESTVYKYDINNEKIVERIGMCNFETVDAFIPINDKCIFIYMNEVIIDDRNFTNYVYKAFDIEDNVGFFSFSSINSDEMEFSLEIEESENECARTLDCSISLENLFAYNFDSSELGYSKKIGEIIKIKKDSSIYGAEELYNELIEDNLFSEMQISPPKFGNIYEEIMKGGSQIRLLTEFDFIYKKGEIKCVTTCVAGINFTTNERKFGIKEKNVENMNFYVSEDDFKLFYTVNNKVVVFSLKEGTKTYVEALSNKNVDKMIIVNNSILRYISDGILYEYDIEDDRDGDIGIENGNLLDEENI